jgi:probable rRNA maturation factor
MLKFFSEEIDFKLQFPVKTTKWIKTIAEAEGYTLGDLNYIFCSDDYLLEINKEYLDHDYYTDIITFDNSEEEGKVEGDIYVSVDRVKENAVTFDADFETEMRRVLIHGLLHLMDYTDTSEALKLQMRSKEDECLLLFK